MRVLNWKRGALIGAIGLSICGLRCDEAPISGSAGGGNGSLKLLITDKPFPFDHIEQALVTITRVEVRRDRSECASCNDGLYCNGDESCLGSECLAGVAPCTEGAVCEEETDSCLVPETPPVIDEAPTEPNPGRGSPLTVAHDSAVDDAASQDDSMTSEDSMNGEISEESPTPASGDEGNDEESSHSEETDVATDDDGDDGHDGHGDDDDSKESPWIVVFEGEKVFDLLTLRNGRTDLLTDAVIPAGTYSQVRLIVTEGQITLRDGRVFPLRVPSGEQTGIKLHFSFTVIGDQETELLLDVDLSRAFRPIPGGRIDRVDHIRGFKFSPSLAMRMVNLLHSGSIAGQVTTMVDGVAQSVAGASVTLFRQSDGDSHEGVGDGDIDGQEQVDAKEPEVAGVGVAESNPGASSEVVADEEHDGAVNNVDSGNLGNDQDDANDENGNENEFDDAEAEEDGDGVTSTSTDADGTYVLSGVAPGVYRVEFSANGFSDAQRRDVIVRVRSQSEGIHAELSPAVP